MVPEDNSEYGREEEVGEVLGVLVDLLYSDGLSIDILEFVYNSDNNNDNDDGDSDDNESRKQ